MLEKNSYLSHRLAGPLGLGRHCKKKYITLLDRVLQSTLNELVITGKQIRGYILEAEKWLPSRQGGKEEEMIGERWLCKP